MPVAVGSMGSQHANRQLDEAGGFAVLLGAWHFGHCLLLAFVDQDRACGLRQVCRAKGECWHWAWRRGYRSGHTPTTKLAFLPGCERSTVARTAGAARRLSGSNRRPKEQAAQRLWAVTFCGQLFTLVRRRAAGAAGAFRFPELPLLELGQELRLSRRESESV